jgi:RHS repeat-associated protein
MSNRDPSDARFPSYPVLSGKVPTHGPLGRKKLTSFTDTSGNNVANQIWDTFDGLGQLTKEYQEHSGLAGTNSAAVSYAFTEMAGGANNSRPTSITYPDGRLITLDYNPSLDDAISRISAIGEGAGTNHAVIEGYSYLGLSTIVQRDRPQNNTKLTLIQQPGDTLHGSDGGDQYVGLDRFNRTSDDWWLKYSGTNVTATLDRSQMGYDANSNVLYKNNLGPGTAAASFSELYHASGTNAGYDALNRLTGFVRGTLSDANSDGVFDTVSTPNTTISGASGSQTFNMDALGNQASIVTDGTTQSRTTDQQNELTSLTTGTNTTSLAFDNNGNLTTDDYGKSLVYDAWNHLVSRDGKTLSYDPLGRVITTTLSGTTHDLYYSTSWQLLQDNLRGIGAAEENVFALGYVNDLIERDRDTNADGQIQKGVDERVWVQQDANHNVTSLADGSGNVLQRIAYDPYLGFVTLSASWTSASDLYAWKYYGQGGRYDSDLKLYNFQHRWYSPTLQVWTQQDPIGYTDGANRYQFTRSSPASQVDPLGLTPIILPPDADIHQLFQKITPRDPALGILQTETGQVAMQLASQTPGGEHLGLCESLGLAAEDLSDIEALRGFVVAREAGVLRLIPNSGLNPGIVMETGYSEALSEALLPFLEAESGGSVLTNLNLNGAIMILPFLHDAAVIAAHYYVHTQCPGEQNQSVWQRFKAALQDFFDDEMDKPIVLPGIPNPSEGSRRPGA